MLEWTKEQIELREKAREFAVREIKPLAAWIEGRNEPNGLGNYPRELIRKMGQAGFMGTMYPKEYGGSGLGIVEECIIAEEFAYYSPAAELARLVSCSLFGYPLKVFGSEEQKQKYLPPLIKGEIIGAIAITEPDVGSDTAGMKTTAVLDGDHWVISGEKRFITNGSVADVINLFAITDTSVKAHQGMSIFLFDTKTPGFEIIENYEMMGMHGCRVAHLGFHNCRIPKDTLLGTLNKGFRQLMKEFDMERVVLAAESLGWVRHCLDIALKFSTERSQFGKPIKEFEGISFEIAEIAAKLEASKLMVYNTAALIDKGLPATKEAAMTKLFTGDESLKSIDACLQILAGSGYTTITDIEQYYRDARILPIGGGTREIMKYIIAREVYREAETGRSI